MGVEWIPIVAGGVGGAVTTQFATWMRERRRNREVYRAPQRQAIAEWMVAHNELKIAIADMADPDRPAVSEEESNRIMNSYLRGLMETDRAFAVCRLVVADPACRLMLNAARARYETLAQILNDPRFQQLIAAGGGPLLAFMATVKAASDRLDRDRIELVELAERRLGATAPRFSKWGHKVSRWKSDARPADDPAALARAMDRLERLREDVEANRHRLKRADRSQEQLKFAQMRFAERGLNYWKQQIEADPPARKTAAAILMTSVVCDLLEVLIDSMDPRREVGTDWGGPEKLLESVDGWLSQGQKWLAASPPSLRERKRKHAALVRRWKQLEATAAGMVDEVLAHSTVDA